jgi:hypothetical protein
VVESARGASRPAGSGFVRELRFAGRGRLVLRAGDVGPSWVASGLTWTVRRRADGVHEAIAAYGLAPGEILEVSGGAVLVGLEATERERAIEIVTLLLPRFGADAESAWRTEVRP